MPTKNKPVTPKMSAFLAAIRVMPNISAAADAAGISRAAHYAKLKTSPAYASAFAVALEIGVEGLSDVAVQRASAGWEEPLIYQGGLCYPKKWSAELKEFVLDPNAKPLTIRKVDNGLLQFILRSRHPEYRERVEVLNELDINVVME